LLVLDRTVDSRLIQALSVRPGVRMVYSDRRVVILRQAVRPFYNSKVE